MANIHLLLAFGTTLASVGFGVFIYHEAVKSFLRQIKEAWTNMPPSDKDATKTGVFVVVSLTVLVLHGLGLLDWMDW